VHGGLMAGSPTGTGNRFQARSTTVNSVSQWIGAGILAFSLGVWGAMAAEPAPAEPARDACSLTVLTGYSVSNLTRGQNDYEVILLILRYPLWQARDWPVKGHWALNLEPYAGLILAPEDNVELGLPLFLRYSVPFGSTGLTWFVEGGVGPMYMTQTTEEQSTKFNFIDQAGTGFRYALSERLDLEIGYRVRHVSNGGIRHPNSGINGHTGLVGITYRY
jgi:hypothetical protein